MIDKCLRPGSCLLELVYLRLVIEVYHDFYLPFLSILIYFFKGMLLFIFFALKGARLPNARWTASLLVLISIKFYVYHGVLDNLLGFFLAFKILSCALCVLVDDHLHVSKHVLVELIACLFDFLITTVLI